MIYKKFQDINLSRLGMGNMRLPVSRGRIDEKRAQEIIDYAMAQGINYYDTAYVYHSGESESFLGKALKKYPRDSYYLATKFYVMADPDIEKVFEEQLRKLDTDYIDFYLLHCVNEETCDAYMKPERKYLDFLMEQKAKGRIRHIGFSSHGKPATLERFLNWSDCFELCRFSSIIWTGPCRTPKSSMRSSQSTDCLCGSWSRCAAEDWCLWAENTTICCRRRNRNGQCRRGLFTGL